VLNFTYGLDDFASMMKEADTCCENCLQWWSDFVPELAANAENGDNKRDELGVVFVLHPRPEQFIVDMQAQLGR
jgi:hypothetical protein